MKKTIFGLSVVAVAILLGSPRLVVAKDCSKEETKREAKLGRELAKCHGRLDCEEKKREKCTEKLARHGCDTSVCLPASCPCFDAGDQAGGIDYQAESLIGQVCQYDDALPGILLVGLRSTATFWGALSSVSAGCQFVDEDNGIDLMLPVTEQENAACIETILNSAMWQLNCP